MTNECFNGIHPGKPMIGDCTPDTRPILGDYDEDARFGYPTDILETIPGYSTLAQRNGCDYDWKLSQEKHTLKEFEKPIYYSNGDYKNCLTQKFSTNLMIGNVSYKRMIPREADGPGNFLYNS